jgi:phosphopantothenate synthetase
MLGKMEKETESDVNIETNPLQRKKQNVIAIVKDMLRQTEKILLKVKHLLGNDLIHVVKILNENESEMHV